ncbi:unnamed protein product [Urochloa decumbens]|uniref:Uncharacterized protein n=1 Tax=Urochloa decumbens TaxID=240449 RepID=A0ABC9B264_9POAL
MANAIAGLIAGKLAELGWDDATLMWRFKDDVDGLRRIMVKLQALMHDAEQRACQDGGDRQETVQDWLKDFKAVAYNVDDLLDEFEATELIRQKQPKIKLLFSAYNPLLLRLTIGHKMKKVKEILNNIEKGGQALHLVPQDTPTWAQVCTNQASIASTNGYINIGMVGRNTEKEKIMKMLLKTEAEEVISIIPIIGLGGMGKTTLAQAIFSDKRATIFDVRVWIYVSKKFYLQRIGEIILSTVSKSTSNEASEAYIPPKDGDLQSITEILKTMLPTKKYVIVLDDMWEEGHHNLEKLKQMLRYGGKGSKVILTTRMQHVVDKLDVGALADQGIIRPVRKSDQIKLSPLSEGDCWNVMRQIAFRQDEDLGGLEVIGKQISKKCAGLPLLARSLGYLVSQYKSTEAWEDIRDKKIILGMKEDIQLQEPLECLMLSYYYMPFKFKLCFTYCAVFPKGFAITTEHLIQQWRALGYVQSINGHHCVNYLLGMSFLQISKSFQGAPDDAKTLVKVTMHDLVYDLAQVILDKELIVLETSEQMNWSRLEKHYSRHMQLINYQKSIGHKQFPGKIRSLHFSECSRLQLEDKSFSKFKYLRVLNISGCSLKEKPVPSNILLPSSIQRLLLLRYFDASGMPIIALPKSLHKLQNMQTLILSNCALEILPDNIGSLLNLCYLDLSGNTNLKKLPISFGELSTLSFLKLSGCSKLEELPESIHKIECLRHLDMSGCCALQKLPNKSGSLPKLSFLNLSCCFKLVKLPHNVNLKYLEHLNLSSCYELQSLPQDFGNLKKLEFLNFSDCYKLQVLPESFCQLKHLKDLDLSDCHDLKELPECFGGLFELHYLNLKSCSKLKMLPESFGNLSKLKHLNLSYCVRIEKLPSSFYNLELQTLYMSVLPHLHDINMADGIRKMTSLTLLVTDKLFDDRITHRVHHVEEEDYGCCNIVNIGKLSCHCLEIRDLHNVKRPEDAERAKLRDNPDLWELNLSWKHADMTENKRDAEVLENLVPPRTLERFKLNYYRSRNFPKWMLDISSYLPYLTCIHLSNLEACDSLPPFGRLQNLRFLSMEKMPNIRKIGKEFYGDEGTCKKLRVIELWSFKNLDEWWTTRSGDEDDEFLIPNLHSLHIYWCPNLKFLPCPPKSIHWELIDSDDVLPVHGFGWLSSSTLPFRAAIWSSSISPYKWDRLQHLNTIEELAILGDSSFSTFPEATPCFPSLRNLTLALNDLEILPEWLGQLTTLEDLIIIRCPKLTSLPECIRNLTALKYLKISKNPKLIETCKREDATKISHIPEVKFD